MQELSAMSSAEQMTTALPLAVVFQSLEPLGCRWRPMPTCPRCEVWENTELGRLLRVLSGARFKYETFHNIPANRSNKNSSNSTDKAGKQPRHKLHRLHAKYADGHSCCLVQPPKPSLDCSLHDGSLRRTFTGYFSRYFYRFTSSVPIYSDLRYVV